MVLAGAWISTAGAQPRFARTDSGGVTIATNVGPISALRSVVSVAPEARLRIGAVDGAPEILFDGIVGAVRLPDGSIAIGNGQPDEIRLFSPTGTYLRTVGRKGQGPGEFQSLVTLLPGGGDTLLALNVPRFQLQRFTASGRYLDMWAMSADSVRRRLDGMRPAEGTREYFRNGSFVISTRRDTTIPETELYPTGRMFRPTTTAVWFSRDYRQTRVIGEFGDIQQVFVDVGGGRRTPIVGFPSERFGINTLGGRGTRLCLAADEGPQVHCIDEDGSRLVVRWTQAPVPTPQKEIDDWKARTRARAAGGRSSTTPQTAERIIDQVRIPPTRPTVTGLHVDASRRIFVGGPDLDAARQGWFRYRVFSACGELLGVTDLPPIGVFEIGADYLLGVSRNSDGVEFVVLHAVTGTRPQGAPCTRPGF